MNKPLFDKVIVEKITESKTKSGIMLLTPENNEDFYRGLVVAKGAATQYIEENAVVAISKHSGIDWREGETWYRIIREQDILFVID